MSCSSFPRYLPMSWHPVPRFSESWSLLDHLVCSLFFMIALAPTGAVLAASRVAGNGVDCRLFLCGSTKSTLLPCVRSAAGLSCGVEFLKIASNFVCIALELSAWSYSSYPFSFPNSPTGYSLRHIAASFLTCLF